MTVSDTTDLPTHHRNPNPIGPPLQVDMSFDVDTIIADFYEDVEHINNITLNKDGTLPNMLQLRITNLNSFYQMINNTQRYTAYVDSISIVQEQSTQRQTLSPSGDLTSFNHTSSNGHTNNNQSLQVLKPMTCGIEYYLDPKDGFQNVAIVLGEIHLTLSYPVSNILPTINLNNTIMNPI